MGKTPTETPAQSPRLDILFFSHYCPSLAWLATAIFNNLSGEDAAAHLLPGEGSDPDQEARGTAGELGLPAPDPTPDPAAPRPFHLVISLDAPTLTGRNRREGDQPCPSPLILGEPVRLNWPLVERDKGTDYDLLADCLDRRIRSLIDEGHLEAYRCQRDRTELLADAMDLGLVIHDRFRRIARFNRAAEEMTGLDRKEVLGQDCHRVFPPLGLCGPRCVSCGKGSGNAPEDYQILYQHPTAGPRRFQVRITPTVIGDRQVPGALALLQDITEVTDLKQRLLDRHSYHGLIGSSPVMQKVFATIDQVAFSDYPVLLTGESGTGKELAARAIHAESPRHKGPFVAVNCGAIPANLRESELFGHVRGAFTGAIRDKRGRFELADGGTLFLDEVGDMPLDLQVKLLRVLQERCFEKVGGEKTIAVDVRLISATNRDLLEMVAKGEFREDFYYRLRVIPIHLPPLRERREDLPLIIDRTLDRISRESGRKIDRVAPEALRLLMGQEWRGNVRELISALQYASVACTTGTIEPEHLAAEFKEDGAGKAPTELLPGLDHRGLRRRLHREGVLQALSLSGGNKVKASRLLGVSRATLYRFLRRLEEQ